MQILALAGGGIAFFSLSSVRSAFVNPTEQSKCSICNWVGFYVYFVEIVSISCRHDFHRRFGWPENSTFLSLGVQIIYETMVYSRFGVILFYHPKNSIRGPTVLNIKATTALLFYVWGQPVWLEVDSSTTHYISGLFDNAMQMY